MSGIWISSFIFITLQAFFTKNENISSQVAEIKQGGAA